MLFSVPLLLYFSFHFIYIIYILILSCITSLLNASVHLWYETVYKLISIDILIDAISLPVDKFQTVF